ncbi:DUF1338 domain-containing protein [Celerinatantimonas yamalensis]|uniref:2-oxoadipate dioxygenase/decarboxylase n=1 Tax=Celerinatantimonas yamalensis TaxID=559956 RepID=A0ABW9G846_9GAMM
MTIDTLFRQLWQQYLEVTPSAKPIQQLLGQGDPIINDHIALRTYALPDIGLEDLGRHFVQLGFEYAGDYQFGVKKLRARHLQHPDPSIPKVFISELKVNELSATAQRIIGQLYQQVKVGFMGSVSHLYSGRPWSVSYHDYLTLLNESEYAAWVAAFGYRANHFTVNVNLLDGFYDLIQVNQALVNAGFKLNHSGGEIKGSELAMLEQSSTLADHVAVSFSDQQAIIPSCFYEFALRYPDASGQLYQGFVEASADKIFDSTNAL